MKLPIIVNERGDVSIYRSAEQVERALEAVDVRNGEYVAYDAEGKPLILSVVPGQEKGFLGLGSKMVERVAVIDNPAAEADQSELAAMLIEFLGRVGICPDNNDRSDLSSLLKLVIDKVGYSA